MSTILQLRFVGLAMLCSLMLPVLAAPQLPANMGAGLKELVESYQEQPEMVRSELTNSRLVQSDDQGRVLVQIYANGKVPLAQLKTALLRRGVVISAENPSYRKGVLAVYLPLDRASEIARLPGVSALALVPKPLTNVGVVTSQGVVVHKTDVVNSLGITGAGKTVGILSDSYNRTANTTQSATIDVANNDLPNLTNATAGSPGVKFLIEGPTGSSDEGRGMAQIVHDLAPGADLCFATSGSSETSFANNIRSLRTNPACLADVIVDDIIFLAEPMFSDGQVARAVDDVVFSSTLPGKKVVYFSSAGNRGNGYSSDFRLVANSDARGAIDTADTTINLSTIPNTVDTSGGFHDFDPGTGVDISQAITVNLDVGRVVFQWDDPYDVPGGITSDFNFLVFDASGNFIANRSGTANNFSTNQPLELPSTGVANPNTFRRDTPYRVVIARTGSGTQVASRLRYLIFTNGTATEEYLTNPPTSTYGHSAARGANSVAAYFYDRDVSGTPPDFSPELEDFSSPGPVTIAFDREGVRLPVAEVRRKPEMAAVDGVNTSFFPAGALSATDPEGDGFPNFFGTSAAAPHAAAIAALMLSKNPNLSSQDIRRFLQTTAPTRDVDALFSKATAILGGSTVTLTATGATPTDPNTFRLSLSGTGTLTNVTLDATPSGLVFDPAATGGFPLTVGTTSGPTITSPSPTSASSVLNLTFSGFSAGNFLTFGIDRDLAATNSFGNSADLLGGTTVRATIAGVGVVNATFFNIVKQGYTVRDGFGLIDALAAVTKVPAP